MDDVAAPTTDQPPASAVTTHPAKLALRELHDASNEAEQAWDELQAAEVAVFHAEERWELGHRRLVRAQDDLAAALAPITPPDDGHVHYAGSGATIDEAIAAMGLPSAEPPDDASEVVTRRADDPTATPAAAFAAFARELAAKAAGGGPGSHRHQGKGSKTPLVTGLTRRQAEVIEAVTRHNGSVSAAAKELRATYPTVTAVIKGVGRKGLLPADLIPMLPAAFARYSGV